jgi:hypothetical protein
MACSSCSPSTCNCTPTAICETCIDVTSSECIYYKGYYSNSLGLGANFRFNTFAETIIERVDQLPANLVDTKLTDVTATFATYAANTLSFTFTQTSPTVDITKNVSIAKHWCFATIDTGNVSVSTSETVLPITLVDGVEHTVSSETILIGSQGGARIGWQEIYADLNFYTDTARTITVKLYRDTTLLKSAIVTTAAGTSTSNNYNVSLKTLYNYSSTSSTQNFSIKLDTDTNCTVTVVSGCLEVKEYGY